MRALRTLGWVWCLPYTVLGLIAALLSGASFYRMRPAGVLQFAARHGLFARAFAGQVSAITIGAVTIFLPAFLDDETTIRHEREHTYQAFALGILFPLAYYGASLWEVAHGRNPYWANWFEVQAYAAETDREG